jgi:hypothetical protein
MIPQTFNDWKNCIIHDCKINLIKEFARQRLAVYQDASNQETQKFIELYGESHLQNIINWYRQIVAN